QSASVSAAPSENSRLRIPFEEAFPGAPVRENSSFPPQIDAKFVSARGDVPRVAPAPVMLPATRSVDLAPSYTIDWARLAIGAYILGAFVLFARLGTSMVAVARLRRACVAVDAVEWIEPLEHWRKRLGIGRAVHLGWSPAVSVPLVLGWLNPTIV